MATLQVVVLAPAQSPTNDLYLGARLRSCRLPVYQWHLGEDAPCLPDGALVVVVRYLDGGSVAWLRRHRSRLAGVVLLLDDDIPGAIGDPSLPWNYRLKLARYWWRYKRDLLALCDAAWVSSDVIANALRAHGFTCAIERIDPVYCGPVLPRPPVLAAEGRAATVFYHGQPTHNGECLWLRNVVAEVQRRRKDVIFEVIGGTAIKRAYSGLPRVRVVHAMTYAAYTAYMSVQRFDIGLAPLLDTVFNRSRSFTKVFDIASAGAVGLYADTAVYRQAIRHGENGLLLPMDNKAAWADAIERMAADASLRENIRAGAIFDAPPRTPATLAALCPGREWLGLSSPPDAVSLSVETIIRTDN